MSKLSRVKSIIKFYHVPESPPCRAVEMVASLMDIKLEKHKMNLFAGDHLKEDHLKLNPRHKVPFVIDGNLRLGESRAIMRYLVNKTNTDNPLYPRDIERRAKVDELLDFDIGTLYMAGVKLFWPILFRGDTKLDENADKKHHKVLTILENQLKINENRKFLTGDNLSIGDVSIIASLTLPSACGFEYTNYPSILDYIRRVREAIPKYGEINDQAMKDFSDFVKSNR